MPDHPDSGARPPRVLDRETEHELKNQLAVVVGTAEWLLAETPPDDPRHGDVVELHKAAMAIVALFKPRKNTD